MQNKASVARQLAMLSLWFVIVDSALAGEVLLDSELQRHWVSERGLFKVRFESTLNPIVINQIHAWELFVATAGGRPVEAAEVTITGGMPVHDHGLPTVPRVTKELGDGNYRIEGLRFHMRGDWEITITIHASGKIDVVTIPLRL